jgi:uncharacterized protein (DUF1501 family)
MTPPSTAPRRDILRRDVLRLGAMLPLLATPLLGLAGRSFAAAPARRTARTLVLIELNGGNDGLNTLVPFRDAAYARLRPRLALPIDQLWRLNDQLGLHAALAPLKPIWDAQEMAVVNGVGYPAPNRSHFRSIEIWNGGTDSAKVAANGWLARVPGALKSGVVDGVVLGGAVGPLSGPALRTIQMQSPAKFLRKSSALADGADEASNPALSHVLEVRHGVQSAAEQIRARLAGTPQPTVKFPRSPLGKQLAVAARLLAAGLDMPVIKVSHSGFDTHASQLGKHARLLGGLAEAVAALRTALIASGRWRDTLICTYAEFGRRPAENGSRGTDHGTAAPHFMWGGGVKGGLYGAQPSLTDLAGGDLKHAVDYRRLYATAGRFLNAKTPADFGRPFELLRG